MVKLKNGNWNTVPKFLTDRGGIGRKRGDGSQWPSATDI